MNQQILAWYFAKTFLKYFVVTSIITICVLLITSVFDILQNFKSANLSMVSFWGLTSFKIPHLFNEVSIIISFISTLILLRSLTNNNELVVILSSGVPIWRVFIVPAIISLFIGIIIITIINPIATYGLKQYERIEAQVKNISYNKIVVSKSGIFFFEKTDDGTYENNRIVKAKSIHIQEKLLKDVTMLFLDSENNLAKRIDSKEVVLNNGIFAIKSPLIINNDSEKSLDKMEISTNLSIDKLVHRFTLPEKIPLWNLKESIERFEKSGLSVTKYQLYYYKQLFKPLAMMAMSFMACWFVSLNIRNNSGTKIVASALAVGIFSYAFLEFSMRIIAHGGFNPMIATLLPILFIILISNFVILHFQEA